jgi:hypothetical protein
MARRKTKATVAQDDADNGHGHVNANDDLAATAWKCWRDSRSHMSDWRTEAAECYDIVAGRQWTDDEIATLKEQMRIPVTFNRTGVVIDAVSGYQINSRQDVAYLPREPQDTGPVQIENEASKFYRQQCDAEDEESDAFFDALVCGLGTVEHRMDYDDDPEGMLKIERVDSLEMGYDPTCTKRNLSDRRWDIRGKWWDKATAKATFPDTDFDNAENVAGDLDVDGNRPVSREAAARYEDTGISDDNDRRKDKVFILEYTWYELKPFITALNPLTGKNEDIDTATLTKLNEMMLAAGKPEVQSVKRKRKAYKRAFVFGRDTIEEGEAPCPHKFHYQFITGKRDRNKNVWYGLVRPMKDPQRWANKFLSQTMHMINANAKGGLVHDEGAFERPDEIEKKMAKPGWVISKRQGYEVQFVPPTPIPNNTFQLTEFSIGSSRDVTGVNLELLGMADREQAGILEHARKQSAMAILAPFFDALRRYHKESGRLTLYFIGKYMTDGRMIRISGQAQAQYLPLTKVGDFQKYDVVIDQSPTSPNSKQAVFGVIAQIFPTLAKAGVMPPPEILDYIPDLPASLVQKWKEQIGKPNPDAEKAKELEMADKAADVNKKGADAALSQAKAQREAAAAGIDQATALANIMSLLEQIKQGQVQTQLQAGDQQLAGRQQMMAEQGQAQTAQQQDTENQFREREAMQGDEQRQIDNEVRARELAMQAQAQQAQVPNG